MARRRSYASPDSVVASKRIKRGKSTRGTKRESTVTREGKTRYLSVGGTPTISRPTKRAKAKREATRVKRSLARVRKAYKSGPDLSSTGLDPEQRKVLGTVLNVGRKVGATRKEKLAAVETGLVESNLRNLDHGDRDSLGWRQERAGQYGAENARNVKGGAKRFFQESISDTGGSRGKGQTAGQLAQTIQGSAHPERYDQRKGEAKALLRAADRPKVKPKKKDLKVLRKAGVRPRAKKKDKPKKRPGPWAGSQKAVLSKVPKAVRPEGRGDKRTPAENAAVKGSATSDHLTTNKKSYAADLPADDSIARHIAKKLGLPSHTGTNTIVKDGYKYQLIWQDSGHYDHVHFGAEWVGDGVPPGTTLGGPSGGGASSGMASSGGGGTPSSGTKAKAKKDMTKRKLARVRAAYPGSSESSAALSELSKKYGSPRV